MIHFLFFFFFFFNDTATTEIYTLSLHDALPISTYISPLSNSTPCIRKDRISSKSLMRLSICLWKPSIGGLRKRRNATSLNSRFKSLDTLKVKIISVTFRRVIRTNHKKASKIWRHENIQLGGCQS